MGYHPPKLTSQEIETEARMSAELNSRSVRQFLKTINMTSEVFLAQVLIALWDSGLYEYVRHHERVEIPVVAAQLGLDVDVLRSLIEYLVGRGLMKPDGDAFELTDTGRPYWNYVTRGVLTAHVAGYNQLLVNLGPLLRKELDIYDPRLDRSARLVALGAGYSLLGSGVVPWVLKVIKDIGGHNVLDLGCGAGGFLIQLARKWPDGRGIGIDMAADVIVEARKSSVEAGVADRVDFYHAKLSSEPMPIRKEVLDQVDTLTAMYMLHEFGGSGGPDSISEIIALLRQQFPGRKLLMAEGAPADPIQLGANPPFTYSQLDYSFFHPLSRQGPLRTPDEWNQIITNAGARLIERVPGFNMVPAWISLYVIDLE